LDVEGEYGRLQGVAGKVWGVRMRVMLPKSKALLIFLLVIGIAVGMTSRWSRASDSIPASMINLIATPERYAGKQVAVIGVLMLDRETAALFFHQEDFDTGNPMNAVMLNQQRAPSADEMRLNGKIVSIEGIFSTGGRGHLGSQFPGTVTVIRMNPVVTLKAVKEMQK
jgi:hypothetical protein